LLSMVIVVRFLCQEMARTARDVSWQLLRSGKGKGDCDGAGSCAVQPNRGKEHTTLGIIGLVTLHSRRSARRKSEQRRRVGNCVQVEDGSSWRQLSVPRRDRCTQGEKGGEGGIIWRCGLWVRRNVEPGAWLRGRPGLKTARGSEGREKAAKHVAQALIGGQTGRGAWRWLTRCVPFNVEKAKPVELNCSPCK